jgi:transcriptional regulator with XRE-family HTH domain
MYQIKLNAEDSIRLKKIIKQMMIKEDLKASDLSRMTGYSKGTIDNYLSGKGTTSRFVAAALCEVLNISTGVKK